MKTAVSIPDPLFAAADALAERQGLSRSGLYAAALAEYVAKHTVDDVTRRLDAVYATQESALAPDIRRAQRSRLARTEW